MSIPNEGSDAHGLREEIKEGKEAIMDEGVKQIADIIYGENGSEDYDTMVMTGSSVLNRFLTTKGEEFGTSIPEVGQKGYKAVQNNTEMYQQAVSGKFPDEKSEAKYKQALQVAYGLYKGTIEKHPAQFFFKKGEATGLRKKLKSTGKVGIYDTYAYPEK